MQVSRSPVQNAAPRTFDRPAPQPRSTENRAALVDGARLGAPEAAPDSELTATFRQQFADKAQDKAAFHALMEQVYGSGYDVAQAEQFRQSALAGDFSFLPPIELVPGEALEHGNAAYDAQRGVVYLNEDLAGNPAAAGEALVEEFGHHLDARLNTTDTVGDEGELFRRLLGGETLSKAEIAGIRAENDKRTITLDGKQVEVEFIFGKVFKSIGKAASSVGKAIGGAAKSVASKTVNAFSNVGKAFKAIPEAFKVEPGKTPWESFKNGFKMPFKVLGSVVKAAVSVPVALATPVFATAGEILKPVFNVAGKVLGPVLGPVGSALGPVLGKVGEFLAPVLGPVFQAYDFVMAPFREVLGPVFEPLGGAITELTGHLPQPLSGLGSFVGDIVGDPATWVEVVLTGGIATVVRKGATVAVAKSIARKGMQTASREVGERALKAGVREAAEKAAYKAARSTMDDGLRAASKGAKEAYEKTLKSAMTDVTTRSGRRAAKRQARQAWKTSFQSSVKGTREASERAAREAAQETLEGGLQRTGRRVRFRETAVKPSDVRKAREFAGRQMDDIARGGNASSRDRLARLFGSDNIERRMLNRIGREGDPFLKELAEHGVAVKIASKLKDLGMEGLENEVQDQD